MSSQNQSVPAASRRISRKVGHVYPRLGDFSGEHGSPNCGQNGRGTLLLSSLIVCIIPSWGTSVFLSILARQCKTPGLSL